MSEYEFQIDGQPLPPLDAARMLDEFLQRTGGRGRDAYSSYTEHVLRELLVILEAVLADEGVPRSAARRILRGVIYGGRPHHSDEDLRTGMMKTLAAQQVQAALHIPPGLLGF